MKSTSLPLEERVETLLKQMTLSEKVSLLSGIDNWHTQPIERLGIPSITMTDGPHGVRVDPSDALIGRKTGPATSYPTGVSMAASWNPELIERVGKALGEETRAMGCNVLLGPCVNIVRTPLAGRNFEAYSEDPYLAGKTGAAWIRGLQSQLIGCSLKHFACNNQEFERGRGSSVVDERTLREIYLAQFEMIVKEAHPWTVMCSYNRINGVYASQNTHTLREILKDEWGFDGAVVSDWGANHTIVESVKGGLDIEMPGPAKYYGNLLVEAVNNWQIDEAVIDGAARRILRLILRTGVMDDPAQLPAPAGDTPEHRHLARELAEESITLLKNDNNVLPLGKAKFRTIAVIGPNAAEARIGGGGSSYLESPYRISPMEGLKRRLGRTVRVEYEMGCDNKPDSTLDAEMLGRAVSLAERADIVLLFMGMPTHFESEGADRPDMHLPGPQTELIRAVAKVNRSTVVILNAGSPVELPWIDDVSAVLLTYYPGQEGGNAVAGVLFGDVPASGKLPVTFPRHYEDNPTYSNYPGAKEAVYSEGIFVGYRYYDKKEVEPLFPFGFGLSYTSFGYSGLEVPASVQKGQAVTISMTLKNTGKAEGKEVVQLYIQDMASSLVRPLKELKGFQKVALQPGESQVLTFTLDERALAFYDPQHKNWVAEPGEFTVLVGSSSRDIRLSAKFTLVE
jgi:beta-glucosidase